MKRALLPLLAIGLLVAGCGARPAGTDGNLVNGWKFLPAAAWRIPIAGHCYTDEDYQKGYVGWVETGCGGTHRMDVVGAGDFGGAVAAQPAPPTGPDLDAATTICTNDADEYLGGDIRDGWFKLQVEAPSLNQWTSGNHMYICEVASDTGQDFTGTVKGDLAGAKTWTRGCENFLGDEPDAYGFYDYIISETPTACTQPHNAEWVGRFDTDGTPQSVDDKARSAYWDHCESLAAGFIGLSVGQLERRDDVSPAWIWLGEGGVRCYLMLPATKNTSKSMRNLGSGQP